MKKYEDLDDLVNLSNNFYDKVIEANSYFEIAKQFKEIYTKFADEMSVSSFFYSYTKNAIVVATIMETSKIYDRHPQSINLGKFMDICYDQKHQFPQHKKISYKHEGTEYLDVSPFRHSVLPEEKEFFQNEYDNLDAIDSLLINTGRPLTVDMTIEKYFDLFRWKYERLENKIDYLLKQRNKIYAHNDENKIFKIDEIMNKYPLHYDDIENIISFSYEFISFVIAMLTGVSKAKKPINYQDWEHTLQLVKIGLKYESLEYEKELGLD